MAFSGDRTEYPSPRNLSSSLAKDQTGGVSKKNQGTELSPLSEYSGDEDAQYVPDRAISPSQRPHTSPLTKDRSSFKNAREGDRPLQSRESSSRTPTVGVAPVNSTRHPSRASSSGRSSEKTLRTSREPSTTSSFKSISDGAHSSRALNRAHGRKGTQYSPRVRDNPLPHADSSSSIESLRWHEEQSISVDAEAIFEQLGTRRQSVANENSSTLSQRQGKGLDFPTNRSSKPPSPRETTNSLPQPTTDPSDNHNNPPRAYEPHVIQRPRRGERNSQTSDAEQRTWLSTVSSSAYHSLLDRYGEVEIKRQQIIWDLCETERAFVRRLQTFVHLFICPLRMKDSVTWLTGVPPEVARLFDWHRFGAVPNRDARRRENTKLRIAPGSSSAIRCPVGIYHTIDQAAERRI